VALESAPMRLVTWNCCSGPLDRKLSDLATLAADIAVVPECPRIPEQPGAAVWMGTKPTKGLAVFASSPWQVHRAPAPRGLPRYAVPVQVSGPESFLLLAVWAMPHPTLPYVRGMHRAVRACRSLIEAQPTVLLGDFNSNAIWDAETPRLLPRAWWVSHRRPECQLYRRRAHAGPAPPWKPRIGKHRPARPVATDVRARNVRQHATSHRGGPRMDAIALAQSLDASKDAGGNVSLRRLEQQLAQNGHDELARAVRALAGSITAGKLYFDETVPWF